MIPEWMSDKLGNPREVFNIEDIGNGFCIFSIKDLFNVNDLFKKLEENNRGNTVIVFPSKTDTEAWQKMLNISGVAFVLKGIQKDFGYPITLFGIGRHAKRIILSVELNGCYIKHTTGIKELCLI
jgi:hypothetical protein